MQAPAPRPDTTRLQRLVHSYRDSAALRCEAYFARAGFRDVAAHEFVPAVLTRVTGTRPASPGPATIEDPPDASPQRVVIERRR